MVTTREADEDNCVGLFRCCESLWVPLGKISASVAACFSPFLRQWSLSVSPGLKQYCKLNHLCLYSLRVKRSLLLAAWHCTQATYYRFYFLIFVCARECVWSTYCIENSSVAFDRIQWDILKIYIYWLCQLVKVVLLYEFTMWDSVISKSIPLNVFLWAFINNMRLFVCSLAIR